MRKFNFILFLITSFCLSSCGVVLTTLETLAYGDNGTNQTTAASSTSTRNSSGGVLGFNTKKVESSPLVNDVSRTSDAKSNESDSNISSFVGDGYTFDVKGNVKNISYESSYLYEYVNVNFDTDGKLNPEDEYVIVKRNGKGQITEHYYDDGGGYRHEYEYADDGKVSKIHSPFWDVDASDIVLTINYDGDNVGSVSATYKYDTGNYVEIKKPKTFNTQLKVSILTTDDKGNWLTRKITGERIVLSDKGFEYAGEADSGSMYYSKEKVDFTEKRKITYFDDNQDNVYGLDPDLELDNIKETYVDSYGWSGVYEGTANGSNINLTLRCTGNGYYEGIYSCVYHLYRVHAKIEGKDKLNIYEDKGQWYFVSMVSPGYYDVEKLQNYKIERVGDSYSTYRDCQEECGGILRKLSKVK